MCLCFVPQDTWIYGLQADPKKTKALRLMLRERAKALAADASLNTDPAFVNQTRWLIKLTEHTFGETHGRFDEHVGWSNKDFRRILSSNTPLGQKYRNFRRVAPRRHSAVWLLRLTKVSRCAARRGRSSTNTSRPRWTHSRRRPSPLLRRGCATASRTPLKRRACGPCRQLATPSTHWSRGASRSEAAS